MSGITIGVNKARYEQMEKNAYVGRKAAIEAGVKVYLYMGGFNHSKLLVSDDNLCTVGSTNIDFRSFENNFEANAFFYDEEMAQRIKAIYLKDESQSILVDDVSYFVKRPFMKRLFESIVRLLSPLL